MCVLCITQRPAQWMVINSSFVSSLVCFELMFTPHQAFAFWGEAKANFNGAVGFSLG